MKGEKLLERIILDPGVMTGKPVIRGTRLTVQFILGLLALGASETVINFLTFFNCILANSKVKCIAF
ncbi:MAG: DUF433 domain-containing protein [Methanosarcinales archaeon]|nr:DUF433 domain-containing protein [Methanosarcinales archaeon]